MHNAPAVSYPVGRSVFHALGVAALLLLVAAVDGLWQLQGGRWGGVEWMAVLAGLLAGGLALAAWWRAPAGTLQWDGEQWRWLTPGGELSGRVDVRLDWQHGMLLEFQPIAGPSRWCWAECHRSPAAWADLRRAVRAGAAAQIPAGGAVSP